MNGLRTSAAKNDGRLSKATDPPVPAVGVDRSLLNFMPDYLELPKHTTTLLYKARDGETKELRIVQPVEPAPCWTASRARAQPAWPP